MNRGIRGWIARLLHLGPLTEEQSRYWYRKGKEEGAKQHATVYVPNIHLCPHCQMQTDPLAAALPQVTGPIAPPSPKRTQVLGPHMVALTTDTHRLPAMSADLRHIIAQRQHIDAIVDKMKKGK